MSIANLAKVEKFTFEVNILIDGVPTNKFYKFPTLLRGIIFCFAYRIAGLLASDEISIYDTFTKKKLVKGDIREIYDVYLDTFPRPKNLPVDEFAINIDRLLSDMKIDTKEGYVNPTVQHIQNRNREYFNQQMDLEINK